MLEQHLQLDIYIKEIDMKQLILIMLISSHSLAQIIPEDKLLHLSATYVISSTTTSLVSYKYPKKQAFWIGVAAGTLVGVGKELYDIKHGNPEWGDLGADVVGALLGSFTVTIRF